MNKIFKVIFNRTTQRMEVASELAKNQGKVSSTITSVEPSSSLGKTLKLSLLATVVGLVLSNSTSATVPVAQSGWSAGDYSTVILGETTDNSGPEGEHELTRVLILMLMLQHQTITRLLLVVIRVSKVLQPQLH